MRTGGRRGKTSAVLLAAACMLECAVVALEDPFPPRHPIYAFYPKSGALGRRAFPHGATTDYSNRVYDDGYVINAATRHSAEARERDRLAFDKHNFVRKAAEVHRRVRRYAQEELLVPGAKLIDICEKLENATRTYLEADKSPLAGLKAGIGFPTGVSLNHVAAHYTSNPGDQTVLKYDDVLKVDFGTHVNGFIVDSAFTWAPDPKYEKLLEAVKDATMTGVREAGIDVRLCDVGEAIQEVMESYECEINGKEYQVKCVRNLQGHSIEPYIIHAGKSVPIVAGGPSTKMEEGEIYAIETFGTTGRGHVVESGECSHYALNAVDKEEEATREARRSYGRPQMGRNIKMPRAKMLRDHIDKNFKTLPWCRRYLERSGEQRYLVALRSLVDSGVVEEYPPLLDVRGSYVAQYEHTIILRPTCKEVVSKGEDY